MDISDIDSRWVEIDLDAIKHNYSQIRQMVDKRVKILSVVKANAYGHGLLEVSRVLEEMGTDMLGVTTAQEGRELRDGQVSIPILVFGPFLPDDIDTIIRSDLTVTVSSFEILRWLRDSLGQNRKLKAHLKVETGMGRTGLWPEDIVKAAREAVDIPGLTLEGIYSHLATAMWDNKKYAHIQYGLFRETLDNLEKAGMNNLLRHINNSAAVLDLPEMNLDMVRVGTLLYGQYPNPRQENRLDLKKPWSMKAKVMYVRDLPPGYSVGYGRTFKTTHKTKVAVLPVGFVDGLQVEPMLKPANILDLLKGIAKLILQYLGITRAGQYILFPQGKGRVIGKVGMQLTMVDITGIPEVEVGSVAQIPARRTSVNAAVPKVYLEDRRAKRVRLSEWIIKETSE